MNRLNPQDPLTVDVLAGPGGELLVRQIPAVRRLCRRLVRDPERADELAQDALLVAWRRLEQFNGDSSFSVWVQGITRNICFNAIRRRSEVLLEDGVVEAESSERSALSAMQAQEREELLRRASRSLSPVEQEAVFLRYVEQLPQETITDLLELTEASGARGLLQRCRRKLERAIRAELAAMGLGSSFLRAGP